MKGLLIKDFYSAISQLKVFVVLIVAFALAPGYSISSFAMVYAALLPINALAWDEQSKWDDLAKMLPYSKFDLVFSKYIMGYISVAAAAALSAVGALIYGLLPGKEPFGAGDAVIFALSCAAALLLQALNLPLMFRMGVEKGRLFFGIMVGVFCALIALVSGAVADGAGIARLVSSANGGLLVAAVFVVVAAVNVGSVLLSVKWYGTKK